MATIQKRVTSKGTSYRVMVRLKGYPPETATFERLTDAREWATNTEADMKNNRHFGESKRHIFSELVTAYSAKAAPHLKSWQDRKQHLAFWVAALEDCQLDAITPARIAGIRDKLAAKDKDKTLAGATVVRYLASLSACLAHGVKELQWLERNPVERVTKPKEAPGRVRFLSDDERTALLKACKESSSPDLYPAVVLSLTTGGRQSEIMGLTWEQVDFNARAITLRHGETKNNEARTLPLVGEALALLQARAKVRKLRDNRIFPPSERAKKADRLDLRAPWEAAIKAAGIVNFRWHDLRHTAASYLAMNGVSPLEISKILGHRTMAMVSRYSHLAPGRVVELGDALAARLGLA